MDIQSTPKINTSPTTQPYNHDKLLTRFCRGVRNTCRRLNSHPNPPSPPTPESPRLSPAETAPAQHLAALGKSLIVQSIALRSGLPTLDDLIAHFLDAKAECTFEQVEQLIHERINQHPDTAGGEVNTKRNFLRVLVTDLDLCAKPENENIAQRTLARETLQKDICGHPFMSYGNLNEAQHGDIFSTSAGRITFRGEMMAVLFELYCAWKDSTAAGAQ